MLVSEDLISCSEWSPRLTKRIFPHVDDVVVAKPCLNYIFTTTF